jgi:hypothetical protein
MASVSTRESYGYGLRPTGHRAGHGDGEAVLSLLCPHCSYSKGCGSSTQSYLRSHRTGYEGPGNNLHPGRGPQPVSSLDLIQI